MSEAATRCGFVAVIGAPNAGKSTLVNALVGQKVAIVSAKAQTTRARLMGIAIDDSAQILLVDTPGIFAPRRRLDRAMVAAAWNGADDADLNLLVIDSDRGLTAEVEQILEGIKQREQRLFIALNKVDLVDKGKLLALAADLSGRMAPEQLFMVSATTGDGVADLKAALAEAMPVGPWHFPADQLTDATDRMVAAELTREQLYAAAIPRAALCVGDRNREPGRTAPTARPRSASRSWSSATARKPSSSARAAHASKRSARRRAPRSPSIWGARSTCSCTSRSTRAGTKTARSIATSASSGRTERRPAPHRPIRAPNPRRARCGFRRTGGCRGSARG